MDFTILEQKNLYPEVKYINIEKWMFKLFSGNKLHVFALVHGFSRGEAGLCYMTQLGIADFFNINRHSASTCLTELEELGAIGKIKINKSYAYFSLLTEENVSKIKSLEELKKDASRRKSMNYLAYLAKKSELETENKSMYQNGTVYQKVPQVYQNGTSCVPKPAIKCTILAHNNNILINNNLNNNLNSNNSVNEVNINEVNQNSDNKNLNNNFNLDNLNSDLLNYSSPAEAGNAKALQVKSVSLNNSNTTTGNTVNNLYANDTYPTVNQEGEYTELNTKYSKLSNTTRKNEDYVEYTDPSVNPLSNTIKTELHSNSAEYNQEERERKTFEKERENFAGSENTPSTLSKNTSQSHEEARRDENSVKSTNFTSELKNDDSEPFSCVSDISENSEKQEQNEGEVKKTKKRASKAKVESPHSLVKSHYVEVRKRLFSEGRVSSELASTNSALINKRIKDLFDKGVTVEDFNKAIDYASKESWFVEEKGFDFSWLVCDGVFFNAYKKMKEEEAKTKQTTRFDENKKDYCPCCHFVYIKGRPCHSCGYDETIETPQEHERKIQEEREKNRRECQMLCKPNGICPRCSSHIDENGNCTGDGCLYESSMGLLWMSKYSAKEMRLKSGK